MSERSSTSVYTQIAVDIAHKIVCGTLKENDKFSGRSLMAAEYKASTETIRRALRILANMDILEINHNSGVRVISRENAVNFISQYKQAQDIRDMKLELKKMLNERDTINTQIVEMIDRIIDLNEKYKSSTPLLNFEFNIPDDSSLLGKSIAEMKFWQNTGATIVAIRRDSQIILSPGPDAVLCKGDSILVVGKPDIWETVSSYIK